MQSRITELDPPRKLAFTWGKQRRRHLRRSSQGARGAAHRRSTAACPTAACWSASAPAGTRISTCWPRASTAKSRGRSGTASAACRKEYDRRIPPDGTQAAPRFPMTARRSVSHGEMSNPVVSRDEWLNARLALLKQEKELTRLSDQVARRRQELPWVQVDKPYRFDTDQGSATLEDLFGGRSQLLVYHFMFGPDYKAGCPSCSMIADGFNGFAVHLANHDVALWAVSRAPLDEIAGLQAADGMDVPVGLLVRRRFQLRFHRLDLRGAAARGRRRIQLSARRTTR